MNTYVQCTIQSTLQQSTLPIHTIIKPSGISKKSKSVKKHRVKKEIEPSVKPESSDIKEPLYINPFYEKWFKGEEMDYIGFIVIFYKERQSSIGVDQLFTFVREKNYYFTYPIIFDDDDDPDTFRYKKYIIQKCTEYLNIKKKYIQSITYLNDNGGVRNYIIRLKKLYPIHDTNLHTINCIDTDKYIWRQYIIMNSNWMNNYHIYSDFPDNYNSITIRSIYDTLNCT